MKVDEDFEVFADEDGVTFFVSDYGGPMNNPIQSAYYEMSWSDAEKVVAYLQSELEKNRERGRG